MKVLFLTIALSLFSLLQAQDSSSSEEQFGGTYFVKAIVKDTEFHGKKKPKEASPMTITHLSDGDLEIKFTVNMNGTCKEIKLKLRKTNMHGLFSVDFSRGLETPKVYLFIISADEGKRHILIEKTSVRDHWIIICEGKLHGMQLRIAKLVGPYIEENPQAFEDYKKFVSLKGFNEEKIKIPRQAEACTPERD